jgi:hypothetical protein
MKSWSRTIQSSLPYKMLKILNKRGKYAVRLSLLLTKFTLDWMAATLVRPTHYWSEIKRELRCVCTVLTFCSCQNRIGGSCNWVIPKLRLKTLLQKRNKYNFNFCVFLLLVYFYFIKTKEGVRLLRPKFKLFFVPPPFLCPQSTLFSSITVFFSEVPCFLYIVWPAPSRLASFTFLLWYTFWYFPWLSRLVHSVSVSRHSNCRFCTSSVMSSFFL